ncbi:MAG: DUF4835 family protein [Candidatus Marinimicrobia bacterium]|nr:DUF4835 family protein [Candidatus Neomarinimicrobiota bacterium]
MKRIIIFLLLSSILFAQTFVPNVSVEGNNLNAQEERILEQLQATIEQYILSNSFSNERYDLEIPYRITIYVTQVTKSGSKLNIATNAFFSNEYDQRYIDNAWVFEFTEGEVLYREMMYHPLRDIIDYYGYLIMASEMDGIEDLGGNSIFDLANEIYSRGSSSRWSNGWNSRKEDFDKLTGDFRLRRARYLYNQAFWALDDNQGTKAWYLLEDALKYLIDSKNLDSQNKFLNFFVDKHFKDSEYFISVYQDTTLLPLYRKLSPENQNFFDGIVENIIEGFDQ